MKSILKIKYILSFCIILSAGQVLAQKGDYLITNHKPSIKNIDNINFQITQDKYGLMYLANRSGILVYDGLEWDFYATPGAALSMGFGPKGDLYVGCLNDFGKISFVNNSIRYVSLSGQFGDSLGMVYQVINYNDKMIFVTEKVLFIYDDPTGKIETHNIEENDYFYNLLFILGPDLFANISDGSINRLNKEFKPDSTFLLPDFSNLSFIRQNPETGEILAGSFYSNLYKLNAGEFKMLENSFYFSSRNILLMDGQWYDKDRFVLGTLEKGCFILNLKTGKISMDTINFSNGLPDNEITALYVDNSHGIWVANEFGLSRITPEIPVKSFSHYPGLQGNLFALQNFKDHLYVSSSVGVYYLDEIRNYKNTVYYVRKTKPGIKEIKQVDSGTSIPNESKVVSAKDTQKEKKKLRRYARMQNKQAKDKSIDEESESSGNEIEAEVDSKPGFLKRIFSKNQKPENEIGKIQGIQNSKVEYTRKVRRELQSVEYMYKPVEGIQAKVKQLILMDNKLLAVSNSGVFEINDFSATLVINEPVRYLYYDPSSKRLILCGYDRSVKIYKLINDLWVELHDELFNEFITNIGIDPEKYLWLIGPSLMYRMFLTDTVFMVEATYPIQNQMIESPLMTNMNQKIYFIYSKGYFYFDGDSIREDNAFKDALGLPVKLLQSTDGLIWVYNGKIWNRIDENGKEKSFEYLSLFPDIKYLDYNKVTDVFGILTSENKIYFYEHSNDYKIQPSSDVILKRITTNNRTLSSNSRILLTYEDNTISFKYSEPDYLGLLKVEYQYLLEDDMKTWSEWSIINSVNFNYLQPGKYRLKVRARDTFGRIKESTPIDIQVKSPYWKLPWFYAIEILVFGSMIFIVNRLRRINTRYPFIVDGLAIFTLIMIIALIQSTIQEYLMIKSTPVVDFLVNVGVAVIAFPVEYFLKKFLR